MSGMGKGSGFKLKQAAPPPFPHREGTARRPSAGGGGAGVSSILQKVSSAAVSASSRHPDSPGSFGAGSAPHAIFLEQRVFDVPPDASGRSGRYKGHQAVDVKLLRCLDDWLPFLASGAAGAVPADEVAFQTGWMDTIVSALHVQSMRDASMMQTPSDVQELEDACIENPKTSIPAPSDARPLRARDLWGIFPPRRRRGEGAGRGAGAAAAASAAPDDRHPADLVNLGRRLVTLRKGAILLCLRGSDARWKSLSGDDGDAGGSSGSGSGCCSRRSGGAAGTAEASEKEEEGGGADDDVPLGILLLRKSCFIFFDPASSPRANVAAAAAVAQKAIDKNLPAEFAAGITAALSGVGALPPRVVSIISKVLIGWGYWFPVDADDAADAAADAASSSASSLSSSSVAAAASATAAQPPLPPHTTEEVIGGAAPHPEAAAPASPAAATAAAAAADPVAPPLLHHAQRSMSLSPRHQLGVSLRLLRSRSASLSSGSPALRGAASSVSGHGGGAGGDGGGDPLFASSSSPSYQRAADGTTIVVTDGDDGVLLSPTTSATVHGGRYAERTAATLRAAAATEEAVAAAELAASAPEKAIASPNFEAPVVLSEDTFAHTSDPYNTEQHDTFTHAALVSILFEVKADFVRCARRLRKKVATVSEEDTVNDLSVLKALIDSESQYVSQSIAQIEALISSPEPENASLEAIFKYLKSLAPAPAAAAGAAAATGVPEEMVGEASPSEAAIQKTEEILSWFQEDFNESLGELSVCASAAESHWQSREMALNLKRSATQRVQAKLALAACMLAGCSTISGYFGMNLDNGVCGPEGCHGTVQDSGHHAFVQVTTISAMISLTGAAIYYLLVQKDLRA